MKRSSSRAAASPKHHFGAIQHKKTELEERIRMGRATVGGYLVRKLFNYWIEPATNCSPRIVMMWLTANLAAGPYSG